MGLPREQSGVGRGLVPVAEGPEKLILRGRARRAPGAGAERSGNTGGLVLGHFLREDRSGKVSGEAGQGRGLPDCPTLMGGFKAWGSGQGPEGRRQLRVVGGGQPGTHS